MGVLALLFVKTQVTETKGRSLEEIEADLQMDSGKRSDRKDARAASPRRGSRRPPPSTFPGMPAVRRR